MANFRIVRFSKPGLLKRIDPATLLAFLHHADHKAFFQRANVELPDVADPETIPYDKITESFMALDGGQDRELINALYLIDSFSKEAAVGELIESAVKAGIIMGADDPDADRQRGMDVAVRVWLHPRGKEIFAKLEAKEQIQTYRSFRHFISTADEKRAYVCPSPEKLALAAAYMKPEFKKNRRGETVEISIALDDEEETWFMVTHGESLVRDEGVKADGQSEIVVFRPKASDVVIYNKENDELRTNVSSQWQIKLYREQFGVVLFDSVDAFESADKYKMEVFRTKGREMLDCSAVDGMNEVVLKEVEIQTPRGKIFDEIRHRAKDLYAVWGPDGGIPAGGKIIRISYSITFADSNQPRTATISKGSRLIVAREEDGPVVGKWLQHHEVVIERKEEDADDDAEAAE